MKLAKKIIGSIDIGRRKATVASDCHADLIQGMARAGSKGFAIFAMPGLDVPALRKRRAAIGEWPEDADSDLTPLMELLIASDPDYAEAHAAVAGLNLLDLSEASDDEIAAVEAFAWGIKSLLFDLTTEGVPAFRTRLQALDIISNVS